MATGRQNGPADLHGDLHGDLRGLGTGQVTAQVLKVVENLEGEVTRQELQDALSLSNRDHFRKAYRCPRSPLASSR